MNEITTPLFGFNAPFSAIVFGTSGGIGGAINQQIYDGMISQHTGFAGKPSGGHLPVSNTVLKESATLDHSMQNVANNTARAAIVDSGQNFTKWVNEAEPSQSAYHLFGINRSSAPESSQEFTGLQADALDEQQLSAAKETIQHSLTEHQHAPVRLIVVAIGTLHQKGKAGTTSIQPEKTWRELSAETMAAIFATNTIAPALIAKHFLPLLPRKGRSVFAVLSARVGSISDNRLGGWYSYRASKAALNQIIKTTSIELARTRPDAICIGLHPGTVATGLSKPFQANVAEGKLFTPQSSASYLLNVIEDVKQQQSGALLAWDGSIVPT